MPPEQRPSRGREDEIDGGPRELGLRPPAEERDGIFRHDVEVRGDGDGLDGFARGEHVGARAVLDLRAQLLRSGEVEGDRRARVLGFEKLAQLLERVAQRGGGEYRQLRRGEDRAGQRHALTCRVKATICQAYFTEAR